MQRARRLQKPQNLGDAAMVFMIYKERELLTFLPAEYEGVTASAYRLFEILKTTSLSVSVIIPSVGEAAIEIDPNIWNNVKDHISAIEIKENRQENSDLCAKSTPPDSGGCNVEKGSSSYIVFRVYSSFGEPIEFRGKPSTKIYKIQQVVADRLGYDIEDIRLLYDGRLLGISGTLESAGIENDDIIDVMVEQTGGKPVIYLFSPTPLNAQVSLRLIPQWSFSAIHPPISMKQGREVGQTIKWTVKVHPEGTLTDEDSGLDVSYLYWEAKSNPIMKQLDSPPSSRPGTPEDNNQVEIFDPSRPIVNPKNSVLLSIAETPVYLDKVLLALGLHTEARTSFITYWLPDLLRHQHIALRFLPQSVYEKAAPLEVSPTPSSVVRIFMLWKGLLPCEVEEEGWEEARSRFRDMELGKWRDIVGLNQGADGEDGLKVLEWGGMEAKGML